MNYSSNILSVWSKTSPHGGCFLSLRGFLEGRKTPPHGGCLFPCSLLLISKSEFKKALFLKKASFGKRFFCKFSKGVYHELLRFIENQNCDDTMVRDK